MINIRGLLKSVHLPMFIGNVTLLFIIITVALLSCHDGTTSVAIAFAIAYIIPAVMSKWMLHSWTRATGWLLLITASILVFGIGLNIHIWTSEGHTLQNPLLFYDYERDFNAATSYAQTGSISPDIWKGYPIILGTLMKLFGINVVWGPALSMAFTLGSVALAGEITEILIGRGNNTRLNNSFLASLFTALTAIVLLHGTVGLKDAGVMFGFLCFSMGIASLIPTYMKRIMFGWSAVGAILLMILKPSLVWLLLGGVILIGLPRKNLKSVPWLKCAGLILIIIAIYSGGNEMAPEINWTGIAGNNFRSMLDIEGSRHGYGDLMSHFYDLPLWHRALITPFTALVQTLLPLPWNIARDAKLGGFFWAGHLTYFWYMLSCSILGFYIFLWWRRNKTMFFVNLWALWWILCYAAISCFSAGTTARYYLPLIPLAMPMSIMFLQSVYKGNVALWKPYVAIYISGVIVALIITKIFFT